jgi:F0F1-type ATP synthase membrane subunit c/vacuolar-type H+-ATPase subunit K
MTGILPFAPAVADSLAIGAGAVGGALSRHYIGKFATEQIRKDPSLKYLSGEVEYKSIQIQ